MAEHEGGPPDGATGAVDHDLGQSEKESRLGLQQREAAEVILREEFAMEAEQITALLGSLAEET